MQKRAVKNTSRPLVLEVPGGARDPLDKGLHLAALRELLEERGILLLKAVPLQKGFFYFWKHEDRKTGHWIWLIKFVFAHTVSERDAWLFNERVWNSDRNEPTGQISTLFDPEEVSDTFSVTALDLKGMIMWNPEHQKEASNPKLLVVQKQTYNILEHLFYLLPHMAESYDDKNRICYAKRSPISGETYLRMDGQAVSRSRLRAEGLLDLAEGAMKRYSLAVLVTMKRIS
ncbi:uncharacterized protein N7482_007992 [Penicillium canariense]|uniref:Nudix hydrolase domain-containing protein n=1 Tax=Penicillium canariense TaxID=189055 RepID=A0A9W9HXX8_9EURO|nr:uncharacterized protein N7482_007992 [Penicillium canariense]KAJ5160988.1 hypothetical protein N7482_007992 [Penicillium canariense]